MHKQTSYQVGTNFGSSPAILTWSISSWKGATTHHPKIKSHSHKITADGHAAHFHWQFWCSEINICPSMPNSEFQFFTSKVWSIWGIPLGGECWKMEKQPDATPWQCALSHLPYSATLFVEEPNSTIPSAPVFSRSCSVWPLALPQDPRWSSKVIICLLGNSTECNNRSHSPTKRGLKKGCFQEWKQVSIWRSAVLWAWPG